MIYDNARSRSFIDLGPRSLRFNIFKLLFLKKTLGHLKPNFIWNLHGMLGWKCVKMLRVTWRPIYGKNLQKIPSSEPRGQWHRNLVYNIRYSSTTKFVQLMTLVWPWPFLWHDQICFLMRLHVWKLIKHIVMYFQQIVCTQVSDTGPIVLWFVSFNRFLLWRGGKGDRP